MWKHVSGCCGVLLPSVGDIMTIIIGVYHLNVAEQISYILHKQTSFLLYFEWEGCKLWCQFLAGPVSLAIQLPAKICIVYHVQLAEVSVLAIHLQTTLQSTLDVDLLSKQLVELTINWSENKTESAYISIWCLYLFMLTIAERCGVLVFCVSKN